MDEIKWKLYWSMVIVVINTCESCYQDQPTTQRPSYTPEEQREFEELRLDMIREKILNGLGMVEPPLIDEGQVETLKTNILRSPVVSKHMSNRISKTRQTKAMVFAEIGHLNPCLSPNWTSDNHSVMSFKLPTSPYHIRDAILWYRVSEMNDSTNHTEEWEATLCSCINSTPNLLDDAIECIKISQKSNENSTNKQGWSQIRLENDWKSITKHVQKRILLVFDGKLKMGNKLPFISMEIRNNNKGKWPSKRYKRQLEQKDCPIDVDNGNSTTLPCCRTKFWVDVAQLGWSHWIISPSGFNFHYCNGQCNNGFDRVGNHHDDLDIDYSTVLNAYIKRLNLNLKPCCVPKKMAPLTVVITTNGHTANRTTIPNFIVDECSCIGFA